MPASSERGRININKLAKRLRRNVGRAIQDYNMISEGDRVMVCLSGGKDSYTMLDLLRNLQKSAPVNFDLIAVNLDQKQPDFPEHVLPRYLEQQGVPYHVIEQDTYSVVKRVVPEGKTQCGLCSRLRRGALYTFAIENQMTKIALGHHREDILETLFLNMFYGARLAAMPAKLMSDNAENIVIRPLSYCSEQDISRYADHQDYPIIPCTLCGSQDNLQRVAIKRMLLQWERESPGRLENIAKSIGRVNPSHLADHDLFDFKGLGVNALRDDEASLNWLRTKHAEPVLAPEYN